MRQPPSKTPIRRGPIVWFSDWFDVDYPVKRIDKSLLRTPPREVRNMADRHFAVLAQTGAGGVNANFAWFEELTPTLAPVQGLVTEVLDAGLRHFGPKSVRLVMFPRWPKPADPQKCLKFWDAKQRRWTPSKVSDIFRAELFDEFYGRALDSLIKLFGAHPALWGINFEDWAPVPRVIYNAWLQGPADEWRAFLRKKYGTVAALCAAWHNGERYVDHRLKQHQAPPFRNFDDLAPVELPRSLAIVKPGTENVVQPPQMAPVAAMAALRGQPIADYREFLGECHNGFFRRLAGRLHQAGLRFEMVTGWSHLSTSALFGSGFQALPQAKAFDAMCLYGYYDASSHYDSMHAMLHFKTISTFLELRRYRELNPRCEAHTLLEGRRSNLLIGRGGSASARQAQGYLAAFLGVRTGYFPYHGTGRLACCFEQSHLELPVLSRNHEIFGRLESYAPRAPQIRILRDPPESFVDLGEYYLGKLYWLSNCLAFAGLLGDTALSDERQPFDRHTRLLIVCQTCMTKARAAQLRQAVRNGVTLLVLAPTAVADIWGRPAPAGRNGWQKPLFLENLLPEMKRRQAGRDGFRVARRGNITAGLAGAAWNCMERVRLNPASGPEARIWLRGEEGGAMLVQSGRVFTLACGSRKMFTRAFPAGLGPKYASRDTPEFSRIQLYLDDNPDGCEGIGHVYRLLRNIAVAAGVQSALQSDNLEIITLAAQHGRRRAYCAINASCYWQPARITLNGPAPARLKATLNTLPAKVPVKAVKSGGQFEYDFPPESTLVMFEA